MKKVILIIISLILLTSCSVPGEVIDNNISDDKIKIVTTTFATYDWVCEIIKGEEETFDVTYLLDGGMDLHSFQPTVDDIVQIINADLFIYIGGESESWVVDVLKDVTNDKLLELNLLEAMEKDALAEELVEGMEEEEEEEEEDGHQADFDEHIWLSLKNAKTLVSVIKETIVSLDPNKEALYSENLDVYTEKLQSLDEKYENMILASEKDTLLFGDRFPFRYFVNDYSLGYFAAFVGCSAETEASFETVIFLSNKLDEYGLNYCLTVDSGNKKLANTIIENSQKKDREILTLDSMQKLTSKDIDNGLTYLGIMEENYLVFEKALK